MTIDPLLDLERKKVVLVLSGGEEIRGRLLSTRGDLLTIQTEIPRRRRVVVNRYELRTIEEEAPKVARSPRLARIFGDNL